MRGPEDARLRDRLEQARRGERAFTYFLDPAAMRDAERAARESDAQCAFYGGHGDAERCMACFYPDWMESPEHAEYPISAIILQWDVSGGAAPTHRDVLGSVLGLGLARDRIGDILVSDDCAILYAEERITPAALGLTQIGRVAVRAEIAPKGAAVPEPPKERVTRTVQTLRLDAILAEGLDIARDAAQTLIRAGQVKRNHRAEERVDRHVEAGDVLSVRGHGRLVLVDIGGESKKGRTFVEIERSVKKK